MICFRIFNPHYLRLGNSARAHSRSLYLPSHWLLDLWKWNSSFWRLWVAIHSKLLISESRLIGSTSSISLLRFNSCSITLITFPTTQSELHRSFRKSRWVFEPIDHLQSRPSTAILSDFYLFQSRHYWSLSRLFLPQLSPLRRILYSHHLLNLSKINQGLSKGGW